MRTPLLLPQPGLELEEAIHWYDSRRFGLGEEFRLAFNSAIESACLNPECNRLVALRTRRIQLRRFPYFVLYNSNKELLIITGLFHARRDPLSWVDRIREPLATSYMFA